MFTNHLLSAFTISHTITHCTIISQDCQVINLGFDSVRTGFWAFCIDRRVIVQVDKTIPQSMPPTTIPKIDIMLLNSVLKLFSKVSIFHWTETHELIKT